MREGAECTIDVVWREIAALDYTIAIGTMKNWFRSD
jgi:hypothetical protein